MNKMITLAAALMILSFFSCNNPDNAETKTLPAESGDLIFPRGELIKNNNFTGKAWLISLVVADSVNTNAVGVVKRPPDIPHWHGAGPDEEYSASGN